MSAGRDRGIAGWLLLPVFIVIAFFVPFLGYICDAFVLIVELCRFIWWAGSNIARLIPRATFAVTEWISIVGGSASGAPRHDRHAPVAAKSAYEKDI